MIRRDKTESSNGVVSVWWRALSIGNWVLFSGMLLYLHHRNSKLFFHPAKFDNLKDEKILDYKTVSVAQSKKLLDWKLLPSLVGLWAIFEGWFLCFGRQLIFLKSVVVSALKSCIKWSLKKYSFFSKLWILKRNYHRLNLSYIVLNYLYSGASHHSSKISEAAKKGQNRNQNQTDRKKNSAENSLKDTVGASSLAAACIFFTSFFTVVYIVELFMTICLTYITTIQTWTKYHT